MNNRHLIKSVTPGSIAEEMEIEAGDYLLEVNGTTIVDIFDLSAFVYGRIYRCCNRKK